MPLHIMSCQWSWELASTEHDAGDDNDDNDDDNMIYVLMMMMKNMTMTRTSMRTMTTMIIIVMIMQYMLMMMLITMLIYAHDTSCDHGEHYNLKCLNISINMILYEMLNLVLIAIWYEWISWCRLITVSEEKKSTSVGKSGRGGNDLPWLGCSAELLPRRPCNCNEFQTMSNDWWPHQKVH